MSDTFLEIKGRFERVKSVSERTVEYCESEIALTTFSGGTANGQMLQITVTQSDGNIAYVQLTRKQVEEAIIKINQEMGLGF